MAVKTDFPKRAFFVVFFILGAVIGCTQLFAPIHELAHVYVAQNNGVAQASVTGWASASMSRLDRPAILSGWTMQVILFSIMAIILAIVSPKSTWTTGGFWYGAAVVHWIRAYGSTDFNSALLQSFTDQGTPEYYTSYRSGLVSSWSIMGIVIFLIVGLVILARIKGKAPA